MNRIVFLFFWTLCSVFTAAQPAPLPSELKAFLLPGHEVLDFATGDLNNDKRPDAILILRVLGEDSLLEEDYPRPLLVLTRQSDGKLKQVVRNDSAIMCRRCGGAFGDPYEQTDIHNNGFSLYFYGGSAWRWAYEYQFTWKPVLRTWLLVKESQSSFNSGDPEMTMKEVNIQEPELGQIAISGFSTAAKYEGSKWKVKALKTFFYDTPRLGSQSRKGYLLKGNTVTGIRHLTNFIEVSYDNGKSGFTQGYILRRDLLRLK